MLAEGKSQFSVWIKAEKNRTFYRKYWAFTKIQATVMALMEALSEGCENPNIKQVNLLSEPKTKKKK